VNHLLSPHRVLLPTGGGIFVDLTTPAVIISKMSFAGIKDHDDPQVIILPIPYGGTVSFGPSVRSGPERILTASQNLEDYDEELLIPIDQLRLQTLPPLPITARGPEDMVERIATRVADLFDPGRLLITIGGEHTITIGVIRGIKRRIDRLSVIIFDGHDDLRSEYQASGYSHACVARRISEEAPVVILGVRGISLPPESRPRGVEVLTPSELRKGERWKGIIDELSDPVYLSIDLDVLDPALMPAVGSPEPDGLSWHQLTTMMRYIIEKREVVGGDVVELAPLPGLLTPDFIAARLIMKLIVYWVARSR